MRGASSFTIVAGVDLRDQVFRDRHHERHPSVALGADDDDAGFDAVAVRIGELAQLVFSRALRPAAPRIVPPGELRFLDLGRALAFRGCARLRPSAC